MHATDSIVEECDKLFGMLLVWDQKKSLTPSEQEDQKMMLYQQKNYYFGQLGSFGTFCLLPRLECYLILPNTSIHNDKLRRYVGNCL